MSLFMDDDIGIVAAKHHVSLSTVKNACRIYGVHPIRRQSVLRKLQVRHRTFQILSAIITGGTDSAIAARLGASKQWVNYVRKEALAAGIKIAAATGVKEIETPPEKG
jgi:FixJ family two-component response regulator